MTNALSRRALLTRSLAFGASTLVLSGCGSSSAQDGSATTLKKPGTTQVPVTTTTTGTNFTWKPLRIGAGGYVTGLEIAPDGTKVVRCDSAGAFIWSATQNQWQPLLTSASMPAGEWGHEVCIYTGVYAVAIAPSNTSRIYVVFNNRLFRSDDKGATFTKTAMPTITASAVDDYRFFGKKMAVDPANPNVVLVGCQAGGLFISRDGGANWTHQTAIPNPASARGVRIAFDPSSTANGATPVVYVSSQGNGIYRSTDGGASFNLMPGSPLDPQHMVCDKAGRLWVTDGTGAGNLRRWAAGSWSAIGPSNTPFKTIALDPGNSGHVVIATAGGSIVQTWDGGATWTDTYNLTYPAGSGARVATDIPWLAWTNENYMTSGAMQFDPTATNKLYFAEGIGVWWSNPPSTYTGFNWNSQSVGIEQLVSNQFITPPTGGAVYLAWDRPVFRITNPDAFPSSHGPNNKNAIIMGWGGDYAPDNASLIVAMMNNWGVDQSGYSTDGGTSWSQFGSIPPEVLGSGGKIGGSLVAGSSNNFVWVTSNSGNVWYTNDRGSTWSQSSIPGVPTTGETGWGWVYYLHRQILAADKVNLGTIYIYNYMSPQWGLYRSTNGGASFTRVFTGAIAPGSNYNAKLYAVPGKAGHLFFTSGPLDGSNPSPSPLMRSTDGGATWTAVPNVLECYACGFGKSATSGGYPAIYIAGYLSGKWGIYRSDDNAASWTSLGANPLGNADTIKTISGDMQTYGKVYVGFGGSGSVYGTMV
jgi:photosystem II stability/assembly factor-like uncharacterized protein